jgi:CHAP domain
MNWAGSAFVWTYGNVPLTGLPVWIQILYVQLCSGLEPSEQRPTSQWLQQARDAGFDIAAWHWCTGENPEAEAAYHATTTHDHGIRVLVANMEAGYDAHGNSQDGNYKKPGRYLEALHWDGPLGVTTTPKFASDMTAWRDAGAVYMPQSFPTAGEGGYDLPTVVSHGEAWGWARTQIRPLVQTYAGPAGRPDANTQNQQATELGVGVSPYTVEQSIGSPALEQLRAAIERPTSGGGGGGGEPVPPTTTDWWEQAYKGGPMVKVKGFPRPLYPPDAAKHGKRPSSDGPDTIAYKRTVSRAGRWPWQPFDDSYSNPFSHGKSGNVKETGVAGIQRQQHIDATGWIGEKTFNTLRSIRVPEGMQHAGEMAMDAYAAELINEAFDMYQGAEPAPEQSGTIREAALQKAIGQIGYTESPAGSNQNKYGDWYGMNHQPWCAMFVTWCYELNETGQSQAFIKGERYSYCPYVVADARAGRYGLKTTDDPIPGDLVVYDWSWDTIYDHIGLFESWLSGNTLFTAIEGNTSTSSNSNGGQVMRRDRARSDANIVFIRVAE